MTRRSIGPLVALLLLPSAASADRVMPPPDDCPAGSIGHSEHAGQWCVATTCESDGDCTRRARPGWFDGDARYVCRQTALCVVTERYQLGHRTPEPEFSERTVARGPCIEGRCPAGGECQTAGRCVPADESASEPAPSEPATEAEEDTSAASASEAPAGSGGGEGAAASEPEASGGCAVGRGEGAGAAAVLLGLLALAVWRTR